MDSRILANPATSAFRVEKYPFFVLNRLVSRYNAVIGARLRAIDLDIPSWRVLMILGEDSPRGVRDIADAAVIPLSTMTRIVQRMAAAGLVEVSGSMADARVTEVALTTSGDHRLAEARAASAPVFEQLMEGFGRRDFDRLLALLGRFYDNLESAQ